MRNTGVPPVLGGGRPDRPDYCGRGRPQSQHRQDGRVPALANFLASLRLLRQGLRMKPPENAVAIFQNYRLDYGKGKEEKGLENNRIHQETFLAHTTNPAASSIAIPDRRSHSSHNPPTLPG